MPWLNGVGKLHFPPEGSYNTGHLKVCRVSKEHPENRIDQLEEHIRSHSDKTSQEAVSDKAFYSYRHANRLFKSLKGESIQAFANKIRIQKAAEQLKYTSQSVFDIALGVGYESTAAFSKAFKKFYGQSPSVFRQQEGMAGYGSEAQAERSYFSEVYFDRHEVYTRKVEFGADTPMLELYQLTIIKVKQLTQTAEEFMLFWDEDPELSQLPTSRFFVAVDAPRVKPEGRSLPTRQLQGRFAIFETKVFEESDFESWHLLAHFIIDLEGKEMRAGPYIEWYPISTLDSMEDDLPLRIGIPIH